MKLKANFKFMIETTVDSLLFGYMGRLYILKSYLKRLKNVRFQHFSKIRKILKKPPLRKKNSYGYDYASRHDVRVFIHSSYISFEIKTATDLQRFYVWAPEFFLRGFPRFWH